MATTLLSWLLWSLKAYQNHTAAHISGSAWFDYFWGSPAPTPSALAGQYVTAPFEMASSYNQPMWTIKRELLGSFLVYGILLVGQVRLVRWGIMGAAAYWFAGNFFQCFVVGLMIADLDSWWNRTRSRIRLPAWVSLVLVVVVVICGSYPKYAVGSPASHATYWFAPPLTWLGGGWSMLGAVALFVLVLHAPAAHWLLTRRPVLFLGKVSYSMYGMHFIVLGSVVSAVFTACLPACGYLGSAVLALVSLFLVTLLCAKVMHETVDRCSIAAAKSVGSQVLKLLPSASAGK